MSNAKRIFSASTDAGELVSIATTKRPIAKKEADGTTTLLLWALVANVDGNEAEILSLHNNFCGASDKRWAFKKQENSRITNLEVIYLTAKEGA
jgi:hypothetical protein